MYLVTTRNILTIVAVTLCSLPIASCIHNDAIGGPQTPLALQAGKTQDQQVALEISNFYYNRCLLDKTVFPQAPLTSPSPNCGSRQAQRDTIIFDIKGIVDSNYEAYARHFEQTADTTTFLGEVGAASLTAVGTLVGETDLKDMLTTASTLTQATNTSIQKNFYQKQTEYAILAQMDSDRANEWSQITQRMAAEADKYSLSAALNDLKQYKRVGSATAALTSMTQKAGAQTAAAKTATDQQVKANLGLQ